MSAAPRFSTADIAKGAQQAEARAQEEKEREERERAERERAQATARVDNVEAVNRAQAATEPMAPFTPATTPESDLETAAPLFAQDATEGFRRRWDTIQASFVDDPRRAVQEADSLVAETMQRLADTFAQERTRLEQQFERDDRNVSTEDLRVTLRHYRSFFTRLLAV